jgi:hypothetical protein
LCCRNRLKYLNSLVSYGTIFHSIAWEILKYVDIKRILYVNFRDSSAGWIKTFMGRVRTAGPELLYARTRHLSRLPSSETMCWGSRVSLAASGERAWFKLCLFLSCTEPLTISSLIMSPCLAEHFPRLTEGRQLVLVTEIIFAAVSSSKIDFLTCHSQLFF